MRLFTFTSLLEGPPYTIGADVVVYPPGVPLRPLPGGRFTPLYPPPSLRRNLRSDPYFVLAALTLAASLAAWAALAVSGAGRSAPALLCLPSLLAAASMLCWAASMVPDWDLYWMERQRREP